MGFGKASRGARRRRRPSRPPRAGATRWPRPRGRGQSGEVQGASVGPHTETGGEDVRLWSMPHWARRPSRMFRLLVWLGGGAEVRTASRKLTTGTGAAAPTGVPQGDTEIVPTVGPSRRSGVDAAVITSP